MRGVLRRQKVNVLFVRWLLSLGATPSIIVGWRSRGRGVVGLGLVC